MTIFYDRHKNIICAVHADEYDAPKRGDAVTCNGKIYGVVRTRYDPDCYLYEALCCELRSRA